MKLNEIEGIVREIVTEIIAYEKEMGAESIKVNSDDSLIEGGLIDSILSVQLIEECMMKFDIIIHPIELSLENFDSINKISQFVRIKLNGQDE